MRDDETLALSGKLADSSRFGQAADPADVRLSDEQLARLEEATAISALYPSSNWVEIDGLVKKRLGVDAKCPR